METAKEELLGEAERIAAGGVLGRSRFYRRLLEYLIDCSAQGRTPKEFEIGTEVFGKGADFDPSQDSIVRVYAHHLRQRIQRYYQNLDHEPDARVSIPRGEYRVVLVRAASPAEPAPADSRAAEPRKSVPRLPARGVPAVHALAAIGFAAGLLVDSGPGAGESANEHVTATESAAWRAMLDDDLPIVIVVGDYYIVGELDAIGNVGRLVREFDVNSGKELGADRMFDPDARYVDLDLMYLPRSTAFAMHDMLRVLYKSDKPVRVVSMSDFSASGLKTSHVVYIGYISALDKLSNFVFTSSSLSVAPATTSFATPSRAGPMSVEQASLGFAATISTTDSTRPSPGPAETR